LFILIFVNRKSGRRGVIFFAILLFMGGTAYYTNAELNNEYEKSL